MKIFETVWPRHGAGGSQSQAPFGSIGLVDSGVNAANVRSVIVAQFCLRLLRCRPGSGSKGPAGRFFNFGDDFLYYSLDFLVTHGLLKRL